MANGNDSGPCTVIIAYHSSRDAFLALGKLRHLADISDVLEGPGILATDKSHVSARFRTRVQGTSYYQSALEYHKDLIKSGEVVGGERNRPKYG